MSVSLPIPTKKSTWLLAIKLIVVAFVAYYPLLYYVLEHAYQGSLSLVDCSDDNDCKGFDLYGWVPKYATSFSSSQADLFIKTEQDFEDFRVALENEGLESKHKPWIFCGGESLSEDVSLHYQDLPKKSLIKTSFCIRPFGQKTLFDDGQRVVLSIYAKPAFSQDALQKETFQSVKFAPVRIDPIAVFMTEIVKVLLLPPLSNGLLIAVALAVAWSFEKDTPLGVTNVPQDSPSDAKKNKFWKFIKSCWELDRKPFLMLLMILFSLLLPALWLYLRNGFEMSPWVYWLSFIVGACGFVLLVNFVIQKTEQASVQKPKSPARRWHQGARPRY